MTICTRVRTALLMEKVRKNPKAARELGIAASMKRDGKKNKK